MSYGRLIDSKVEMVFNKVKDLAVAASFVKATGVAFNFNTASVEVDQDAPKTIKVVPIDLKKPNSKSNIIMKTIMMKAVDAEDLNSYDEINFSSHDWKIGDLLHQTGRVWVLNVYREG